MRISPWRRAFFYFFIFFFRSNVTNTPNPLSRHTVRLWRRVIYRRARRKQQKINKENPPAAIVTRRYFPPTPQDFYRHFDKTAYRIKYRDFNYPGFRIMNPKALRTQERLLYTVFSSTDFDDEKKKQL